MNPRHDVRRRARAATRVLSLASLLVFPSVAAAEGGLLPVPAFVSGADAGEAVRVQRAVPSLRGGNGLPFVREAEVQVRNQGFDFGRQRYTLQLSPKGVGEGAAVRGLSDALNARDAGTLALLENRARVERYRLAVDLTAARVLGDLHARLAALENERIRVLERKSGSDEFDLGDILRSEASLTRHRERADEARVVGDLLLARARALSGDAGMSGFDTTGWIAPEGLEAWLARAETAGAATDTDNVHLRGARADLEAARAQHRLALAENRRYLSFVELGYDHGDRRAQLDDRAAGRDYDLDRAWLVEVGIRLPWISSGGGNILRRRAEVGNREAEYRRERADLDADAAAARAELRAQLARHRSIAAREAELDVPARLRRVGASGSADPLLILTLRQAQLENALRREEARFGALRAYLEAADLAGAVSRPGGDRLLAGGEAP